MPAQKFLSDPIQMTEDSYYILEDLHKHAQDDRDAVLFMAGHLDYVVSSVSTGCVCLDGFVSHKHWS